MNPSILWQESLRRFDNKIVNFNFGHFGDIWARTSLLLRISEILGKPTVASAKVGQENISTSIVPYLRTHGELKFVKHPHNADVDYCENYRTPILRTKKTWEFNPNSRIIAYQFDGRHESESKNLPTDKIAFVLDSLRRFGYEPIDVGHMKPIPEIINILSECKLFVGCPSGLSVVSMSVGNPILIITKDMSESFIQFHKACN
jgi:hypothetical protein